MNINDHINNNAHICHGHCQPIEQYRPTLRLCLLVCQGNNMGQTTQNVTEGEDFFTPYSVIFQTAVTVFLVTTTEVGDILTLVVVIK